MINIGFIEGTPHTVVSVVDQKHENWSLWRSRKQFSHFSPTVGSRTPVRSLRSWLAHLTALCGVSGKPHLLFQWDTAPWQPLCQAESSDVELQSPSSILCHWFDSEVMLVAHQRHQQWFLVGVCLPKPKCDYIQHEQVLTILHDAGEVFRHALWLWWLWPWQDQNCEGMGK